MLSLPGATRYRDAAEQRHRACAGTDTADDAGAPVARPPAAGSRHGGGSRRGGGAATPAEYCETPGAKRYPPASNTVAVILISLEKLKD